MVEGASAAHGHVLIVEDDSDIRDAMRMALELEGYSVAVAAHGREALDKLSGMARPCLILLDLMMPVMNGIEFLAAKRADHALASVPVAIVSAYGSHAPEGTAGFVAKPIDLDALLAFVHRHCRDHGREDVTS